MKYREQDTNHKSAEHGSYGTKSDEYYARIFSWLRSKGLKMMADQLEFLNRYEKQFGRIPAKTINEWKGV